MAVLIICCASPPAWLLARLSARGGAAGSAGRVVPGTQPGRWGATLGPPLVSLGSQSLWVSTALRCATACARIACSCTGSPRPPEDELVLAPAGTLGG